MKGGVCGGAGGLSSSDPRKVRKEKKMKREASRQMSVPFAPSWLLATSETISSQFLFTAVCSIKSLQRLN